MFPVQEFIRDKGIEALKSELGVEAHDYGDFWNLSYSQIDSPKFHAVVRECRGSILAKSDLRFLCRPFDRFYNYLEDPDHEKFDLASAWCFEKIDGSLVKVWWNPFSGEWCAGTRNMAFAEGPTSLGNTFLSVVEKALHTTIDKFMRGFPSAFFSLREEDEKRYTFLFEVVSPETRVVTPYPDYDIYLLSVRHNEYGYLLCHDHVDTVAKNLGVKRPKLYRFKSMKECEETFANLRAFDEGYVASVYSDVHGGKYWFLKVKNPAYLAIAHLRNNGQLSTKRIAKLVMLGEEEEYLSYFPEDRQFFEPYIKAKIAWLEDLATTFADHKDKDQKSFALAVKDSKCAPMLFLLKKGLNLADTCNKYFNCDEKYATMLDKYLPPVV